MTDNRWMEQVRAYCRVRPGAPLFVYPDLDSRDIMTDITLDNTPLSFESPESSTISEGSYDPDTNTLKVCFKGPGVPKDYTYAGVPPELWIEFEMSASKGKFFASRIRPFYVGARV